MSAARFETLGFRTEYSVVLDPLGPVGGVWDCPSYAYGRNGKLINEFDFESRWGTPLVIRVTTATGAVWIGAFAAGGLGVVRGVYATPSPRHVCAVVDGLAYLVDAVAPNGPAAIVAGAVVDVVPVLDVPLLLLAGDTDLAGIRDDGTTWSTPRVAVDELRVLRASAEAIVCLGDVGGRRATITLTPMSGEVWGSDYR